MSNTVQQKLKNYLSPTHYGPLKARAPQLDDCAVSVSDEKDLQATPTSRHFLGPASQLQPQQQTHHFLDRSNPPDQDKDRQLQQKRI